MLDRRPCRCGYWCRSSPATRCPALAQASATIAEADGIGNVDVNIVYYPDLGIVYYPDLGCAGCAGKSRLQVPRWRRGHQRATVTSRGRSPRPSFPKTVVLVISRQTRARARPSTSQPCLSHARPRAVDPHREGFARMHPL